MAQYEQIGAPFSVVMTSPELTISDVMEASFKFDPELNEHKRGSSRFPRYTIGDDNTMLTFKTTDKAAIAALLKGMEVEAVTLLFKGTYTGVDAGPTVTQSAVQTSCTISNMRVVEAVEVKNDSDGKKPMEVEFTLRAAEKEADGAAPTIVFAFAAAP